MGMSAAEEALMGRAASKPRPSRSARAAAAVGGAFDLEALYAVLIESVEPASWVEVGGAGTCRTLGNMLVVNQTPAVHEKIGEFLEQVRREGGGMRPVVVRAHWLFLDPKQLAQLVAGGEANKPVSPAVLAQLAADPKHFHGQVTCFDGQTVHVFSGRSRSVVTSLTPVVAAGAVAYEPQVTPVHDGAVLQITPVLASKPDAVVLDVQSTVTQWEKADEPIEVGGGAVPSEPGAGAGAPARASGRIDRMNYLVHRLATTLRLPLGQPVLVGGMTFEPGRDDGKSPQLYLVVEVATAD